MTIKELIKIIEPITTSVEDYNSNNAWGFGGAFGKKYHLKNGWVLNIATACYRHTGQNKFVVIKDNNDNFIMDAHSNGHAFLKAYDILKQFLEKEKE